MKEKEKKGDFLFLFKRWLKDKNASSFQESTCFPTNEEEGKRRWFLIYLKSMTGREWCERRRKKEREKKHEKCVCVLSLSLSFSSFKLEAKGTLGYPECSLVGFVAHRCFVDHRCFVARRSGCCCYRGVLRNRTWRKLAECHHRMLSCRFWKKKKSWTLRTLPSWKSLETYLPSESCRLVEHFG